ncbi:MAG: zinc ribbon domain-containing protein, partial [Candidatus Riflebacteria bacterium]|nr:zinc ribbon domain-containing protein [Candidatus Riflebacteria bacterium]
MFCPNCGAPTVDGAAFCVKCGKPLPNTITNNTVAQTNAIAGGTVQINQQVVPPSPQASNLFVT